MTIRNSGEGGGGRHALTCPGPSTLTAADFCLFQPCLPEEVSPPSGSVAVALFTKLSHQIALTPNSGVRLCHYVPKTTRTPQWPESFALSLPSRAPGDTRTGRPLPSPSPEQELAGMGPETHPGAKAVPASSRRCTELPAPAPPPKNTPYPHGPAAAAPPVLGFP